MKNEGKKFEEDFMKSIQKQNVYIYRLRDGSSAWGGNEKTRFQATNAFDFFMFKMPNIFGIELKSVGGTSFPFLNLREDQLKGLIEINEVEGGFGLIIVNFRKYNRTFAINIEKYISFKNSTTKASMNIKDIINIGSVEITQSKKRTRYTYEFDFEYEY